MASEFRIGLGHRAAVLRELAGFFQLRGIPAWATGGFLRDAFLGRDSYDVDISVAGDPLSIGPELAESLGGHYFPLRAERGQARILLTEPSLQIDLMPLRAPEIEDDLRLRDFTIDAMAAPLPDVATGKIAPLDPANGLGDLRARLVRVTGERAFSDDALRMLRGARIATELGFEIEPSTAEAIRRNASGIGSAAAERQRDEIIRICSTDRAGVGFRLLENLQLFPHVFPEMEATRGVEQPKEHYYDVLGHSFAAVDALDWLLANEPPQDETRSRMWSHLWGELEWCGGLRERADEDVVPGTKRRALLKLCALLHDIGKPETKSFEANGRMRFFGHSDKGAELASRLMGRLRFSSREIRIVAAMIDAHLRPLQLGQEGLPSSRAVYRFFRDTGDAGIDTLFLSLGDHLGSVGPRVTLEGFRRHVALISYILHARFAEGQPVSTPLLVDGDILMSALGLEPGPLIGDLLEVVREAQAAGEVQTSEQAISLARSALADSRTARAE